MLFTLIPALTLAVMGCVGPITEAPTTVQPDTGDEPADRGRRPDLPEDQLAAVRARQGEDAQRALAAVKTRFAQRSPGSTFRIQAATTTRLGDTHVLVRQVYRGLPVEQRDLLAIVVRDGAIRILGAPDRFEGVTLPREAGLAPAQAWAQARQVALVGTGERVLAPVFGRRLRPGAKGDNAADWETVVARFESGRRLAVRAGPEYGGAREIFVRDDDGSVVERGSPRPGWQAGTLLGTYEQVDGPINIFLDSGNLYRLETEDRDVVKVFSSLTLYQGADNLFGDGQLYHGAGATTGNGETAAADALISLYVTHKLFARVYHRNGYDGLGTPVTALVHWPFANSRAQSANSRILLGYADVPSSNGSFTPPLHPFTDVETVAHEIGHMTWDTTPGTSCPSTGELGGICEGSADIFGLHAGFFLQDALYPWRCDKSGNCFYRNTLVVRNDWEFGNIPNPMGWGARSFVNPYYTEWDPSLAQYAGHVTGDIVRGMYYFLTVGALPVGTPPSSTALTAPQRSSQYVPNGFPGIGINAANTVWWFTLSGLYMSGVTDFATYRQAMLEASVTLYGKPHTAQYKAVQDAWAAVKVGDPADREAPSVMAAISQKSRTLAEITIKVYPDPSGVVSGAVEITSAIYPGATIYDQCVDECVYAINPTQWGSSPYHHITVTTRDGADNTLVYNSSFTLDVTPPYYTLTSNTANPPDDPVQNYTFSVKDNIGLAWANVKVDGQVIRGQSWPIAYVVDYTFNDVAVDVRPLGDGWHDVAFAAADNYGNSFAWTQRLFQDGTPPEACALAITAGSSWDRIRLTGSGRDDGVGLKSMQIFQVGSGVSFQVSSGAAPGVTDTGGVGLILTAGTYSFYGTCTDQRGNARTTPTQSWTIGAPPPPPCNATSVAGDNVNNLTRTFELGKTAGTVTLSYNTWDAIADRIDVYYQNTLIQSSGCVITNNSTAHRTFSYSGTSSQMTIRVGPNCTGVPYSSGNGWNYALSCP